MSGHFPPAPSCDHPRFPALLFNSSAHSRKCRKTQCTFGAALVASNNHLTRETLEHSSFSPFTLAPFLQQVLTEPDPSVESSSSNLRQTSLRCTHIHLLDRGNNWHSSPTCKQVLGSRHVQGYMSTSCGLCALPILQRTVKINTPSLGVWSLASHTHASVEISCGLKCAAVFTFTATSHNLLSPPPPSRHWPGTFHHEPLSPRLLAPTPCHHSVNLPLIQRESSSLQLGPLWSTPMTHQFMATTSSIAFCTLFARST